MGFFDRFKQTKAENITGMPEMHEVTLTKSFPHADLVPVEYKHTTKFYEDGLDPLTYERERLKGLPADWLMKDKRVPAIKADSYREIEIGRRQFFNHKYSIRTIIDLLNGDIARANDMILRLDKEIAAYTEEENKLLSHKK